MQTYDIRVVTTTGVVLNERLGITYRMEGAGLADMLRARVWHQVHPQEKVHLVVHDSETGEHLMTFQLMPPEAGDA